MCVSSLDPRSKGGLGKWPRVCGITYTKYGGKNIKRKRHSIFYCELPRRSHQELCIAFASIVIKFLDFPYENLNLTSITDQMSSVLQHVIEIATSINQEIRYRCRSHELKPHENMHFTKSLYILRCVLRYNCASWLQSVKNQSASF